MSDDDARSLYKMLPPGGPVPNASRRHDQQGYPTVPRFGHVGRLHKHGTGWGSLATLEKVWQRLHARSGPPLLRGSWYASRGFDTSAQVADRAGKGCRSPGVTPYFHALFTICPSLNGQSSSLLHHKQ